MSKTSPKKHHLTGKPSNNKKRDDDKSMTHLHICLSADEKKLWLSLAKDKGLTLSVWLTRALNDKKIMGSLIDQLLITKDVKARIQIRCKIADKKEWMHYAKRARLTLSCWARSRVTITLT